VRRVQTAEAMFGVKALTVDWLDDSRKAALTDVPDLKKAWPNLEVVTHRGCIVTVRPTHLPNPDAILVNNARGYRRTLTGRRRYRDGGRARDRGNDPGHSGVGS